MNWKSRIRKLTRWRTKNGWRTVKNDEERWRISTESLTEALRKYFDLIFLHENVFLPKIAETHTQRGLEHFETAPPSPIYRKKRRCLPPKDLMKKISKRTPITKFTPLFGFDFHLFFGFDFHLFFSSLSPMLSEICLPKVFRNFTEALRKRTRITKFTPLFVFYGKVTEALRNCFRIWFSSFFSSLSPMLSGICLPKVFGNFTEVLRKPRKPRKPFFKNVEELAAQLLPP